ncbi:Catenin-beta-like protein [Phakopsora pachyrhizi]|uniref:Catenin-beta-like protein n=1 Tax=Phakopsora pachyrhizi TaxID=170000 RepID=A0AAV0AH26_PHAPC|nr:Catenin-beta-like protein [Phakopsora pachyrhizi]CAH7667033.1 Catenin-beta-like protein [Phakopsora pachyrhizi]
MDVSELFQLPAPRKDPTNTPAFLSQSNSADPTSKRDRSSELNHLKSSTEPKRLKTEFKGKQRATEDQTTDQYYDHEEDEEGGRFFGDGLTTEQKQIIDILNTGTQEDDQSNSLENSNPNPISSLEIKKLCLGLERAINKNREMRTKFCDDPEKFVDSEFELSEAIIKVSIMTQDPARCYPELYKLGTLNSLVGLLSHENVDIAISVIEIIQEFTDDDVLENQEQGELDEEQDRQKTSATDAVLMIVSQLVDLQLLEMVVSILVDRLNENEEAERNGAFHCLGLIENLISLDTSLSSKIVKKTPLMKFLLNRIRSAKKNEESTEEQDSLMFQNKQYSSEILAILLQRDEENRKELVLNDGIDIILEVLSIYRKRDPKDSDEIEFMENVFDCLCSVLLEPNEHKQKFLEGEGVELMVIMMKQKKLARHRALKVLDHALSGDEGTLSCERFVEQLGLKTLFSMFMGKKTSKGLASNEDDEHILGILVSLFFNLGSDTDHRLRLMTKFVEEDYEKIDRLIEIRDRFRSKVQYFTQNSKFLETEMDESEIYLMKLDSGLFGLQLCDVVIGFLTIEDDGMKDHLKVLLKRQGQTLGKDVLGELKEYFESMGEGTRKEGVSSLLKYIESIEN